MDHTTASYYRSILFNNAYAADPIPASLVKLHQFAHKRCMNFGMNNIAKLVALQVVMDWVGLTGEGRKWASRHPDLAGLFDDPNTDLGEDGEDDSDSDVEQAVNWDAIEAGTKVVVEVDQKPTPAAFAHRSGGWLHVKLPGQSETQPFRVKQVKLAGV